MALDPEELQKRRMERQQRRQARQRRSIVKLVVAVLVLLFAAAVIIALLGRGSDTPSQPEQTTQTGSQETGQTQTQQTQAAENQDTVIRFAAVGDVNITERTIASGGAGYDYSPVFLDVAHLLADADITAMNLEGVLADEPSAQDRVAPRQLLQELQGCGVDLCQVANSYCLSKGVSGLSGTVTQLRGLGLEPLGAFESNEAFSESGGYTLLDVRGVRVAVVAFTKGMDGTALPQGNENRVNLLYEDYASTYQTIDEARITRVLSAVQKAKPDITIALLHWGSEYNDTVSTSQKKLVELMQKNGVDAIIGTHSHFVQQMTHDPETGNFVAYCLGDFLGDAQRAGTEYSVILNLEITKKADGTTKVTGYDYTPIFTVNETEKPLKVVRIREAMAAYEAHQLDRVEESTYNAMQYALGRIEKRVKGE